MCIFQLNKVTINQSQEVTYCLSNDMKIIDFRRPCRSYCNGNSIYCSAFSLVTAGLLVFRVFRLRHKSSTVDCVEITAWSDIMRMKFLAQNVDFNCLNLHLLRSNSLLYRKGKFGYRSNLEDALLYRVGQKNWHSFLYANNFIK